MKSIKCKNCGLTNFASEMECRRCGNVFAAPNKTKREKTPSRFSLSSLLFLTVIGAIVYYIFTGAESSVEQVNANEAKRVASQPAGHPAAGLSRTQYDQQRAGTYAGAVKNSSSLDAHQQHINQTEKTMQQISNGQAPK